MSESMSAAAGETLTNAASSRRRGRAGETDHRDNAIKFAPDAGNVEIVVEPFGDEMFRVRVIDTDIGIRADDIHRLFVEFQQLDVGTAKKFQGTGLGLALTKRIVEAQGGVVSVDSVDQGEGLGLATSIATPLAASAG